MSGTPTPSSASLSAEASAHLAQARAYRAAMDRAARDTATAADELRRYAKFSRPGQPSAHIVQLRQRQAAARLDSARAKQAFLRASAAFVHAAGLALPPRTSLESFVLGWIERDGGNLPD
ncbi:hypothetical protein [Luteibacter sp. SG786]|uniref:hypothetical protein n=1 Tax=Luteibacter sp. SG786 TaxID=2587130 RepID=UPI00141E2689|nr:hypothetical protein [Luteibacter sp. SG786]NII54609.1 multidrug efflux pump subunit AcrA (membrane-fusion protein) [Luteibacter sp. SG786]